MTPLSPSYVIAARRSPVAPRSGAFAHLASHELSTPVIKACLADAGLSGDAVEEVILSNALGGGGNPARVSALAAGLPETVAGLSVDRQCAGGLDALMLADALIRSGRHEIVLAGGVESYSRRPLRFRTFADGSAPEPYEQSPFTPWPDRDPDMAEAANALAEHMGVGRKEQDLYAIESHKKALAAQMENRLEDIVAIDGIASDAFTRPLSERLCDRAPVHAGSITSANMSVAADGAAFCLVVSERIARSLSCFRMEIVCGGTVGGDPAMPGLAPVKAITGCLGKACVRPSELTVAEIMEAFAVQAIACQRGGDLPMDIVNLGGGSLARGHPVGASGAILATRLYTELKQRGGTGLAAIAAAGGLGTALIAKATNPDV
ncbi:acetyl-CoA C-acetyltransferase [Cohaesibacter sp. ES.047]|uniref:thiolase family protein n=1 Tax=Cohaesibacter sp. ES.047 TaxID=1798205 RepID=UPI000BB775DE|nr:thiolase family protein [Cohaesibacter sp. ES.047]SNY92117.1 acetyl-CoA C-acetyltransferase [Cohaesibacter sp. ES.047]